MARDVQETLAALRKGIEARQRKKNRHGIKDGQLPSDTDAVALAAHTMAVIQGMSTLARDGAFRGTLLRVVDTALRCWPKASGQTDRSSRHPLPNPGVLAL